VNRSTERDELAGKRGTAPGAARLRLAGGVPLLRPGEQAFEALLDGWLHITALTVGGGPACADQ
jgi:hypothetical protein